MVRNLRQITKEEYDELLGKIERQARKLGEQAVEAGWKFRDTEYPPSFFLSRCSDTPCFYRPRRKLPNSTSHNPLTGRSIKRKPVPKGYKTYELPEIQWPWHFNKSGCPKMKPFETEVDCVFKKISYPDTTYWTCSHLVGECPAKSVSKER